MLLIPFLSRPTLLLISLRLVTHSNAFETPNPPSLSRGIVGTSSMVALGFTAEVVGASGRMGTFWLDHHHGDNTNSSRNGEKSVLVGEDVAIACPRGTTPGSQTTEGPIYVATPSDAYLPIFEATSENRRKDLVFAGNAGLPIDDRFGDCTILVPHFSVLYRDQWRGDERETEREEENHREGNRSSSRRIQVTTDPLVSPPTYIYGKHAKIVSDVLEANGIATELVPSFTEIKAYSGRKLLWASCFWLLCHSSYNNDGDDDLNTKPIDLPLTVGQVHELRQDDLEVLVDEILPSLRDWFKTSTESEIDQNLGRIIDRKSVIGYLKAYSESITGAIPSVDLAYQEFRDRNAVWLHPKNKNEVYLEQPFHTQLLEEMGVDISATAL